DAVSRVQQTEEHELPPPMSDAEIMAMMPPHESEHEYYADEQLNSIEPLEIVQERTVEQQSIPASPNQYEEKDAAAEMAAVRRDA
ncbi:hypothetical protein ACKI1O_51935, partial [Streptomyces scabiei]